MQDKKTTRQAMAYHAFAWGVQITCHAKRQACSLSHANARGSALLVKEIMSHDSCLTETCTWHVLHALDLHKYSADQAMEAIHWYMNYWLSFPGTYAAEVHPTQPARGGIMLMAPGCCGQFSHACAASASCSTPASQTAPPNMRLAASR